jgi:hypothetical protein
VRQFTELDKITNSKMTAEQKKQSQEIIDKNQDVMKSFELLV